MNIPGWLGPVVGPVVAALAYFSVLRKTGGDVEVAPLVGIAAVGLFAGLLLWRVDHRKKKRQT